MKELTCCFSGHRDLPAEQYLEIQKRLEKEIINLILQGVVYYGAGGALGFDTLAALTVLKLRRTYSQLRLILVLPCRDQCRGWPQRDIFLYEFILSQADKAVFLSDRYIPGCMQRRNRKLVEESGHLICYLCRDTGGTAQTVRFARTRELDIRNLFLPAGAQTAG